MKTKFFTIAAALIMALCFSVESKAQISSGGNGGGGVPAPPVSFSVKSYPNPTVDFINIQTSMPKELSGSVKIDVINGVGQVMFTKTCSDCGDVTTTMVNAKNWAAGMYTVKVTYLTYVRMSKFIKIDG